MGDVIPFPRHRNVVAEDPELQALYNHAARGPTTPPRQSGLPVMLFLMPEGQVHLRTTPLGMKVLKKAEEDDSSLPFQLVREGHVLSPVCVEPHVSPERFNQLRRDLDEYFVVHAYEGVQRETAHSYSWSFLRAGLSPQPSHQPYLWTMTFEHHGGTWVFGTARDLAAATGLIERNGLLRIDEKVGEGPDMMEAFSVESRRLAPLAEQLAREGYWLRNETSWCACH